MGKVDFLELMPMTFPEFLMAQHQDVLADWLMTLDRIEPLSEPVFDKLKDLFREYYIVGGMPEAVQTWCLGKDLVALEKLQAGILNAYYRDFSKYPPSSVIPRILGVWNSVVGQLAKDNRKFMFSEINKGARAREYEMVMDFLLQMGTEIYPVEVKYGENTKSPSLTRLLGQDPKRIGIRYSMRNLSMDGAILNIPIPLVCATIRLLEAITP